MDPHVRTNVPGLREANKLLADLKRLGINDVEPMYDVQVGLWAIIQVFRPSGKILLMNTRDYYDSKPVLMWWCRDPQTLKFRAPNDQDLSDIVVTVKRAQVVFDKGSDWMVDKLEAVEKETHDKNRQEQSEKIRSIAKPMKRAIRRELA